MNSDREQNTCTDNSWWRKLRDHLPLSVKLAACFSLPLCLGIAAITLLASEQKQHLQIQQQQQWVAAINRQIERHIHRTTHAEQNTATRLHSALSDIAQDNQLLGAALYDREGALVAAIGRLPDTTAIDFSQLSSSLATHSPLTLDNHAAEKATLYASRRDNDQGFLLLAGSTETAANNLVSYAIGLFILLVIAMLLISRRLTAPLRALAKRAANISSGERPPTSERRNDELGQLMKSINRMSKDLARKSQVESVLEKFLSPEVAKKIVNELDTVGFKGENVQASVVFADIVGFTQMSEQMSPQQVSELLNEYFGYYAACAKTHAGIVDKFLGDCVMIVFGAAQSDQQHLQNAVRCALLMQRLTETVNQRRLQDGLTPVHLRIGVNSGEMLAGLLGSQDRMEYTVVGDSVNLASRLCNEAKQQQIIIEEDSYHLLIQQDAVQYDSERTIKLRGKTAPASIYNITALESLKDTALQASIENILGSSH